MLRPGGRFAVSDVIADTDMDEATRADIAARTGCIAGALTEAEFRELLDAPGSRRSRPGRPTAFASSRRGHHPRARADELILIDAAGARECVDLGPRDESRAPHRLLASDVVMPRNRPSPQHRMARGGQIGIGRALQDVARAPDQPRGGGLEWRPL